MKNSPRGVSAKNFPALLSWKPTLESKIVWSNDPLLYNWGLSLQISPLNYLIRTFVSRKESLSCNTCCDTGSQCLRPHWNTPFSGLEQQARDTKTYFKQDHPSTWHDFSVKQYSQILKSPWKFIILTLEKLYLSFNFSINAHSLNFIFAPSLLDARIYSLLPVYCRQKLISLSFNKVIV